MSEGAEGMWTATLARPPIHKSTDPLWKPVFSGWEQKLLQYIETVLAVDSNVFEFIMDHEVTITEKEGNIVYFFKSPF